LKPRGRHVFFDEITETSDVSADEIKAVLHFASQSLEKPPTFG